MRVKTKKKITPELLKEVCEETHETLRRKTLDSFGAEVFEKRAAALARILEPLERMDEAVLSVGEVLIVKAVFNRRKRLLVVTISPALARELEANPRIVFEPKRLLCFLNSKNMPKLKKHDSKELLLCKKSINNLENY